MSVRNKVSLAATLLGLALLSTGCGGVNATGSVSPASFFLPGLMKNDAPKSKPTPPGAVPPVEVAAR